MTCRLQARAITPAHGEIICGDMINGAHAIIFSSDAEADRSFFKNVLGFDSVDAGDGWLIFALPPSELAVHPAEAGKPGQEIYLMCEDVDRTVRDLESRGIIIERQFYDEPWGRLAFVRLPGGGRLGMYQPRHTRPVHRTKPAVRRRRPQAERP